MGDELIRDAKHREHDCDCYDRIDLRIAEFNGNQAYDNGNRNDEIAQRMFGIRVEHIRGRVKHPQTGGKIERLNGTVKRALRRRRPDGTPWFPDVDAVFRWYNERRPHMSLDFDRAETPLEAFERKLRPKEREAWRRSK